MWKADPECVESITATWQASFDVPSVNNNTMNRFRTAMVTHRLASGCPALQTVVEIAFGYCDAAGSVTGKGQMLLRTVHSRGVNGECPCTN